MQGAAWIALFRRIPAEQHDSLLLMTATGNEIVLQRLLRLERDFLVAIGRLSGSTEHGKMLVIPYDQMTYVGFNKRLSEPEIEKVLGQTGVSVQIVDVPAAATAPVNGTTSPPSAAEMRSLSAPMPAPSTNSDTPRPGDLTESPAPKLPSKGGPPSKSVLLARLRQRLADDIGKPPESR